MADSPINPIAEFPTDPDELAMWRVEHNAGGYGRIRPAHQKGRGPGPPGPLVCLWCGVRMDQPHRDSCKTLERERAILEGREKGDDPELNRWLLGK